MLERIKYLVIGLTFSIIFGIARFIVNQGDYNHREIFLIIVCLLFLIGGIKYSQRINLINVRLLTKKRMVAIIVILSIEHSLCLSIH